MAKPSLANITTTQTFQNWFDKTNELVDLFKSDAITASGPGDSTTGNATLNGNFTSTNLTAATLLSTDAISSRTGGATISFQSPVTITGSTQLVATFNQGSGAQTRYTNGTVSWDVGLDNTSFIINTGVDPKKFVLDTAGTLTVPNLVVGQITADTFVDAQGDPIGGSIIDDTDDVPEGSTNLYFTEARAIGSLTGGDGIDVATDGTISMDGDGVLNTISAARLIASGGGTGTTLAYISGTVIAGIPVGRLVTTYSGSDDTILSWSPSLVQSAVNFRTTGDISATGNVITNYSSSDIRLKENVQTIDNALDKVSQISGYKFNYIDRPDETTTGVIAQEVEKVLPEVVFDHERNNGTYKAVRYDGMIPLLLEAIKELKEKVNDLENRLNDSGN